MTELVTALWLQDFHKTNRTHHFNMYCLLFQVENFHHFTECLLKEPIELPSTCFIQLFVVPKVIFVVKYVTERGYGSTDKTTAPLPHQATTQEAVIPYLPVYPLSNSSGSKLLLVDTRIGLIIRLNYNFVSLHTFSLTLCS